MHVGWCMFLYEQCLHRGTLSSKQASSFFNKNLTNADNDNSMNMSTKMEMSQVNKPANNVKTMQYVKINIQTPVGRDTPTHTSSRYP